MLNRLYVKNVALISEADIIFDGGLNVLSGETGSGKSVILDSINFVLGSKADRTMIRYGEQETLVRAEFIVDKNSEAVKKLDEYDIESDGTIVISRRLSQDGKGAIKVNGNSVTVAMLKNVTQHLVDVHGQSEHFFLLSEENQLKVIDGLLDDSAEQIKEALAQKIILKKQFKAKIASLGGDEAERERKLDLLEFQIKEIESADIKVGEYDDLKARQNVINNVEKILSALNGVKSIFDEDDGCNDGLTSAMHIMNQISDIDEAYNQVSLRLENLYAEACDITETISDFADNLTFDEQEAQHIDERLSLINYLRKKYGYSEEEIITFCAKAKADFETIHDGAATIAKCNKEINACDDEIFALRKKLTALRKNSAQNLSRLVESELKTLNIPDAKFKVVFNDYDRQTANLQSANGSDELEFLFSANKGEPLKPLNKVISGGEMSRFMLAVKTQLKDLNGISTYVFDEIDAGISGHTAGMVAKKFIEISKNTQVLAVSHLPQVCAASDKQLLIYKVEENGKTLTKVKSLTSADKIEEIVRLTGSINSETARQHARELIKQFKN